MFDALVSAIRDGDIIPFIDAIDALCEAAYESAFDDDDVTPDSCSHCGLPYPSTQHVCMAGA